MSIENYIEIQYRKLFNELEDEYLELYSNFDNMKLQIVLSTLHSRLISLFGDMNSRLPTPLDREGYYWADHSRRLLESFEIIDGLEMRLSNSLLSFKIDEYYQKIISDCKIFLKKYNGSSIPSGMEKIELFYTLPIFNHSNKIIRNDIKINNIFELKLIGEGSYAHVYEYYDKFYQKKFALKRAKKDLNDKEIERFKQEYKSMKELKSPYIIDVFGFDEATLEYTMEFMDTSLDKYIKKKNTKLNPSNRKNICNQIIKAFNYIHKKGLLHRDISPSNILLAQYDDVLVVKISDFGLVKIPESNLTSYNTEMKGIYNDPNLIVEGFDKYTILHETYALTRLIYFVITGKTQTDKISDIKIQEFVQRGLDPNKNKRFQNISEFQQAYKLLWEE